LESSNLSKIGEFLKEFLEQGRRFGGILLVDIEIFLLEE